MDAETKERLGWLEKRVNVLECELDLRTPTPAPKTPFRKWADEYLAPGKGHYSLDHASPEEIWNASHDATVAHHKRSVFVGEEWRTKARQNIREPTEGEK